MRKRFLYFSLLIASYVLQAQLTPSENYIRTKDYLSDPSQGSPKVSETVQYVDGLGRPKQIVNVKASPTAKDVVTRIEYDLFGRQTKSYLPVPQSGTQNGGFYSDPLSNAPNIYGSEKIYSESTFENSPLNRVFQQVQAGNDWSNKPVSLGYDFNENDEVKNYVTSTVWSDGATLSDLSLSPDNNGYYPENQLYKSTVTDEDGNTTIEFKNGLGQTILIRKIVNSAETADTYYVYNEYNQQAFIIPPLASVNSTIDTTTLDDLCYQYRYDGKNRLVEKKLPGKGWEYMVYDKSDRLILTRDANLENQGLWHLTKYDRFGRVIITALLPAGGRREMQNETGSLIVTEDPDPRDFTRSGMQVYYTNHHLDYFEILLTVTYYNTYPPDSPGIPSQILGQTVLTQDTQNADRSTKSLPTASYIKNIEDDSWTRIYTYYDTKGRGISSHSINHLGGSTRTEAELGFAGEVLQSYTYHRRLDSDPQTVIKETFVYDHMNRILEHRHQVNSNSEEVLAKNHYNEISQLDEKKIGGSAGGTPLEITNYQYNIRGWLTKVNDPSNLGNKLFGYQIKYTNPENTNITSGRHNGNIAEIDWKAQNDGIVRRYTYQYDELNRLLLGSYSEPNTPYPPNDFYTEQMSYDLNGNIQQLDRFGKNSETGTYEKIDILTYNYNGNQLQTVVDDSGNYSGYPDASGVPITYDDNGNMTSHEDKGILQIDYNFLNLPDYIKFNASVPTRGGLIYVNSRYTYRADGIKVEKIHNRVNDGIYGPPLSARTTTYLDGFQYEANESLQNSGNVLKFVPTSEGYYDFEKQSYIYNYLDHLGNVRLSYWDSAEVGGIEIIEQNNYYPFGLKHEGVNGLTGNQAYKYAFQGQETQAESGWSSFKWRNYIPEIGRFFNIDPLSEKYAYQSHYNFSENRVVDARELEGLEAVVIHGTTQQKTGPSFSNGALKELQKIGGNSVINTSFRWNSPLTNDRGMRKDAARLLITHVLSTREKMIKAGTITENEPVTLIGYSHGGNVAIQAIDRISKQLGIKVNLITVSTPAYSNSSEDPTNKTSINEHTQIVHENDAVTSFYARGEDTYPSSDTHTVTNRVISNEEIKLDGGIEAHTDLPSNKKLPEILQTVPRINNNQQ